MSLEEAQGYIVLATLAVPLAAAFILVLTPGSEKMLVRYISAITGAIVCALSIYIFAAYQVNGDDVQMTLRWTWVENTAFLKENGITLYPVSYTHLDVYKRQSSSRWSSSRWSSS